MMASVTSIKVGSMYGKEELTKRLLVKVIIKFESVLFRVLGLAREKNWIKQGDYIVISFGEIEGVPGTTNSLRIIQV